MKKQLKLSAQGRNLNLSKKTISNLNASEMNSTVGGGHTYTKGNTSNCTKDQNTCPGHNTCYNC
jgi:hypothetical protein